MRCVPFAGRRCAHRALTPSAVTWQVAAQSGQYIKYQCKKGQCGTCEVRVDGKWIRTCVSQARHSTPSCAVVPCLTTCSMPCIRSPSEPPSPPSPHRQVPYVEPGQTYKVQVKSSMKKPKSSSRFYSIRCDRAAVHPPHAQRTPPALAPGAKPNAQPDTLWRVQAATDRSP